MNQGFQGHHKLSCSDSKRKCGLIQGWPADLVLFDPLTIRGNSTNDDPLASPDGIELVVVNGQIVYEHAMVVPRFPGIVLRHVAHDPGHLPSVENVKSKAGPGLAGSASVSGSVK
jgi:hypothetical protein